MQFNNRKEIGTEVNLQKTVEVDVGLPYKIIGVAGGGLAEQVLKKNSNTDYDVKWDYESLIITKEPYIEASKKYKSKAVIYVGNSESQFSRFNFYICVENNGVYTWNNVSSLQNNLIDNKYIIKDGLEITIDVNYFVNQLIVKLSSAEDNEYVGYLGDCSITDIAKKVNEVISVIIDEFRANKKALEALDEKVDEYYNKALNVFQKDKEEVRVDADRAEAYAVGTISGVDVGSWHINYKNNSKYYSEQSKNSSDSAFNFLNKTNEKYEQTLEIANNFIKSANSLHKAIVFKTVNDFLDWYNSGSIVNVGSMGYTKNDLNPGDEIWIIEQGVADLWYTGINETDSTKYWYGLPFSYHESDYTVYEAFKNLCEIYANNANESANNAKQSEENAKDSELLAYSYKEFAKEYKIESEKLKDAAYDYKESSREYSEVSQRMSLLSKESQEASLNSEIKAKESENSAAWHESNAKNSANDAFEYKNESYKYKQGSEEIFEKLKEIYNFEKARNHSLLNNLDYESSGHTGFVPSKLSLINNNVTTLSDRRKVYLFADDNGNASKITLADIAKSVIRQSNFIPDDLQDGQYLFLELE